MLLYTNPSNLGKFLLSPLCSFHSDYCLSDFSLGFSLVNGTIPTALLARHGSSEILNRFWRRHAKLVERPPVGAGCYSVPLINCMARFSKCLSSTQ